MMALTRLWNVYTGTAILIMALHENANFCTEAGCVPGDTGPNANNNYSCPNICQCDDLPSGVGISVICKARHLTRVPTMLPANTVELNLNDNRISNLTETDFQGCFKIENIFLKSNELRKIDDKTFADTGHLRELHLNNNALNISNSTSGFMDYLQKLTLLSIEGNVYLDDGVFEKLPGLNWLALDRSGIVKFEKAFLSLTNLESITIHGPFYRIGNESFENLRNSSLKVLIVRSADTLNETEPQTFGHLRHLETLDLSFNRGLGFNMASHAWYGLQFTNISVLKLTSISSTVSSFIGLSFYNYLIKTNVTTLEIDRNYIVTVAYGLADALPNLINLNISFNRLSRVDNLIKDLSRLRELTNADLSYNFKKLPHKKRSVVNQSKLRDKESSTKASMVKNESRNQVDGSEMCTFNTWVPCRIPHIFPNVSRRVESYNPDLPFFGPWCIVLPRNAASINLTASLDFQIRYFPQTVLLGRNNNFREFVFRSNDIQEFRGPLVFANPSSLIQFTLDAGDNGASCFSPNFFTLSIKRGMNISRLILDGNNLGNQLAEDSNGSLFKDYKDLTEINLARNNIKELHARTFKNLGNLRILNINSNSLRDISFELSHMYHLKYLDLSHNILTELSSEVFTTISQAMKYSKLTLNITGNPIQCSCQTLPFLIWMNENRQNIDQIEEVYCLINKNRVTFDKLDDAIIKPLSFSCRSDFLLIVCSLLLALVCISVITSVCLYRHRWDIRYCLLSFSRSKQMYQLVINQEISYEYDAFISYDYRDRSWITQELIPNIELMDHITARRTGSESEGFRLCIHERDFTAGENIPEQIVAKIKASRKVLLILTHNFIRSYWCKFELEMSQLNGFKRGWNIIVPIMLEQLSVQDIPDPLQMLIRRQTYITWKSYLPDRDDFWRRLRIILADADRIPSASESHDTAIDSDSRNVIVDTIPSTEYSC